MDIIRSGYFTDKGSNQMTRIILIILALLLTNGCAVHTHGAYVGGHSHRNVSIQKKRTVVVAKYARARRRVTSKYIRKCRVRRGVKRCYAVGR